MSTDFWPGADEETDFEASEPKNTNTGLKMKGFDCDSRVDESHAGALSTAMKQPAWRQWIEPILAASDDELATRDVAELNLACAMGLPGAEDLDIAACLRQLDEWAGLVRLGTERMMPRFHEQPREYYDSEAYFRILVMVTVLQRNLGVQYNPECMQGPADSRDARDLFLHGLLSGHGGTCASMPILYLAIGRRLGYPLKLVPAKSHLFVRWEEPGGERFNIECTSPGLNCHDDSYYHTWPEPLSQQDLEAGYYLQSLSPREETARFVAARGHCLADHRETAAALGTF